MRGVWVSGLDAVQASHTSPTSLYFVRPYLSIDTFTTQKLVRAAVADLFFNLN
jgi:hypothetical protein